MKKDEEKYFRLYKGDIIYGIFFLILCTYILAKLGFYQNIKQNIYLTEQKMLSKKIMDYSVEYKHEESKHAIIYYSQEDSEFIHTIKESLDLYYPLLAEDFSLNNLEKEKVNVILYPNAEELEKAIKYNYGQKIPMGVYYGGIINLLSPRNYVKSENYSDIIEYFIENGPIVHELAHHFTDIKAKGNYDIWFSEGIALFYEKKYTNFEWRRDLKESSAKIDFEDLKNKFRTLDEAMAYRRSFDIVNDFVQENGEEALQALIIHNK